MTVYALKTAPAFEVALVYRPARRRANDGFRALRRFATYLGEGFQIATTWTTGTQDDRNKRNRGLDVLADRPTMLRVFAAGSSHAADLAELAGSNGRFPPAERVERYSRARIVVPVPCPDRPVVSKTARPHLEAAASFPPPISRN